MKKIIFKCLNCGNTKHSYKECNEPTTSWGIIMVNYNNITKNSIKHNIIDLSKIDFTDKKNRKKIDTTSLTNINNIFNELKFLMISRKHSLGYSEFIKGEYKVEKIDQVKYLFKQMKKTEIEKIKISISMENGFEYLWKDLWRNRDCKFYQRKKKSFDNYNLLKYENKIDGPALNLKSLVDNVYADYENDEWGFPKGRKNKYDNETDLECAMREFNEETGFTNEDYKIINEIHPIVEELTGTNGILYRHIYFIAEQITDKQPENNVTESQKDEIGNIMMMNFNNAFESIRKYHVMRKIILEKIFIYYLDEINSQCDN